MAIAVATTARSRPRVCRTVWQDVTPLDGANDLVVLVHDSEHIGIPDESLLEVSVVEVRTIEAKGPGGRGAACSCRALLAFLAEVRARTDHWL